MKKLNSWNLKHMFFIKIITFTLCTIPFFYLTYLGVTNNLSANPIERITKFTGTWGMNLLWITLMITPIRKLTHLTFLVSLRRMLGLFSFFYILVHFIIWFYLDHDLDTVEMLKDVSKRPFILVGFIAFVLMIPLALTSINKVIKMMGAKNWKRLHYLIYVSAIMGSLHYYWMKQAKNDLFYPKIYIGILCLLLGYRMIEQLKNRRLN